MALRKLAHGEWKPYFDSLSRKSLFFELEIVGPEIGDQIEFSWRALEGITYDPKRDKLEIHTQGLEHRISHPKEIFVEEREPLRPDSLEIVDELDQKQILKFREECDLSE